MANTTAENGDIVLSVGPGGGNGQGLVLDTWKSYSFNSNFLTPTDGWSFTLGSDDVSDQLRIAIAPRQQVTLTINGQVQGTGIVDSVTTHASRHGGTELTIEGRDILSPVVDSMIDPRVQFKETMTLSDVLAGVFTPFGLGKIYSRSETDLNILSGHSHGRHTTKKGKPIKSNTLHQCHPTPHEGAFAFASRVSQRFGYWIWPSLQGDGIIVGTPDFDQAPSYKAIHKRGPDGIANNILSSTLHQNGGSQPSIIFASGFGVGGENPTDQFTVCVVNPLVQSDCSKIFAAYPNTKPLDLSYLGGSYRGNGKDTPVYNATGLAYVDTNARPLFLHDEDSKNLEELVCFLKRELALRMHKAFVYSFEVEGHEYIAQDGTRTPWNVDTIVSVDDDISNVQQNLWILSRTFTKSRSGGTKTHLECILPHTLEF